MADLGVSYLQVWADCPDPECIMRYPVKITVHTKSGWDKGRLVLSCSFKADTDVIEHHIATHEQTPGVNGPNR